MGLTEISALTLFSHVLIITVPSSESRAARPLCLQHPKPDCPGGEHWDLLACACISDRKCPPLNCPLRFNSPRCTVYKKDESGCPTCQCECTELSQICPVNCLGGTEVVMSATGCRECKCKPDGCGHDVQCDNICPFGRIEDRNGCPTCACRSRRKICPAMLCQENCPYGTFEDTNDCPTCVCKPKPICPLLSCDNFCPTGRVQDSNGCDVCKCNPIKAVHSTRCPTSVCALRCPNGYASDKHGCPTCRCKARKAAHGIRMEQGS